MDDKPRGTYRASDGSLRYSPTGPKQTEIPATGLAGLTALPSPLARALAFSSVLLGGVSGGLIGYGVMKAFYPSGHAVARAVGSSLSALAIAGGTAVLAVLVLRAMGEWNRNVK